MNISSDIILKNLKISAENHRKSHMKVTCSDRKQSHIVRIKKKKHSQPTETQTSASSLYFNHTALCDVGPPVEVVASQSLGSKETDRRLQKWTVITNYVRKVTGTQTEHRLVMSHSRFLRWRPIEVQQLICRWSPGPNLFTSYRPSLCSIPPGTSVQQQPTPWLKVIALLFSNTLVSPI